MCDNLDMEDLDLKILEEEGEPSCWPISPCQTYKGHFPSTIQFFSLVCMHLCVRVEERRG